MSRELAIVIGFVLTVIGVRTVASVVEGELKLAMRLRAAQNRQKRRQELRRKIESI